MKYSDEDSDPIRICVTSPKRGRKVEFTKFYCTDDPCAKKKTSGDTPDLFEQLIQGAIKGLVDWEKRYALIKRVPEFKRVLREIEKLSKYSLKRRKKNSDAG